MADLAYEDHPISNLFPLITDHGLAAMTDDIREHGLRVPIVLAPDESDNGKRKVCDGRNRYRACIAAGVSPRFEDWDGKGSLIDFVVSLNKVRRHLNKSQWAVIGADIASAKSIEIKAIRKSEDGFASNNKTARNAQMEAAESVGVSSAYVGAARAIGKESPETLDEVRKGEKTIPEAQRELGLDKPKRSRKKPKTESANGPVGQSRVNDELVDDPPDIADQRSKGKIPSDVIPDITEPDKSETTTPDSIKEGIDEEKAMTDDALSDDDWLAGLPLSSKLDGSPLKTFREHALAFRALEKPREAYRWHASRVIEKSKRKGPFTYLVKNFLKIEHPKKWLQCPKIEDGGCGGTGASPISGHCQKCFGAGFWIKH